MAKITIEELSDSLKEYLNGSGLTEAQVQKLLDKFEGEKIGDISQLSTEEKGNIVGAINEVKNSIDNKDLSGYQEKTDNGLVTTDKTIVGAINELFQNANNGKELIANAIGEPLSKDDTFSAMSNDINGLLATFKTNMMNNGVTVGSGDKFKALIDKIAMLANNEGKGIKFAEGSCNNVYTTGDVSVQSQIINHELGIIPTYIFVNFGNVYNDVIGNNSNIIASNIGNTLIETSDGYMEIWLNYINESSFTMLVKDEIGCKMENVKWYAIGVGEEDTTLRDSLANILQEEGVGVTEEDDMASLISKVDSEFTKDNNAISGLESDISNGKSIIANAIGEPLSATDTFTAMGKEIEELLEYFREKLKSIGVTDSLDNLKLKGLIDKVRGITKYSITKNLTNCTINNDATIIEENSSYNATITANSNYLMKSITVIMGGVDVTNNVVTGYNINITSVTGDIVISAVAEVNNPYPPGTNVNNTVSSFSAYKYNPVTKTIPVEANGNYTLSFNYGPNISNQGYTASVSVRVCDASGNTVNSYNESSKYSSYFSKDLSLQKGYKIEITASISVTTNNAHCNQVSSIQLIFNSL